jgi:hypothetical protein
MFSRSFGMSQEKNETFSGNLFSSVDGLFLEWPFWGIFVVLKYSLSSLRLFNLCLGKIF